MALPTFVSASAKAAGTGAVTPNLPASMSANDIVVLVATTIAGGSLSITANGSIGTWNALTGSPIDVTGGEKLYVWWGRWTSGTTGPTVTPGSDHCCAGTAAWSGVDQGSAVINVSGTGTEVTSDTSFSFATGISTTKNNCLCLCVASNGADSNTGQVPVMTNANLTSLASRMDFCTNSGGGGGFGLSEGALATAGAMGTFACTMGTASPKAYIAFALLGRITTTQTTTGKARIQATTTKTQPGKARVQITTTQTQPGKARVQARATKTTTGKGAIRKTTTKTQTGKARVQITTNTDSGLLAIDSLTGNFDQSWNIGSASSLKFRAAHFVASKSYTLRAVRLKLKASGTPAFTLTASIYSNSSGQPGALIGVASGAFDTSSLTTTFAWILFSDTLSAALTSGVDYWVVLEASATNASNFVTAEAETTGLGTTETCSSTDGTTWTNAIGKAHLVTGVYGPITGKARIQITSTTSRTQPGKARVQSTASQTQPGKARVQVTTDRTITGNARLQISTAQEISGTARIEQAGSDVTVSVSGLEAAGAVGTVTISTGAQTSTSIGWTEFVLGIISGKRKTAKVTVQGIEAIGAVGQVIVTTTANVSVAGVSAMARLGTGRVAISINARIRTAGGKAAIGWPDVDAVQNLQDDELCALVSLLD